MKKRDEKNGRIPLLRTTAEQLLSVIPAEAGIQDSFILKDLYKDLVKWIPAFAGMTRIKR